MLARLGIVVIATLLTLSWAGGGLGGATPAATAAGPGIITTFAGGGPGPGNGDGGPATNATLSQSKDVAFDSAGNAYIP